MIFLRKHNLIFAISSNLIILGLCLVFGIIKYGVMDDYFMSAILTGAHGDAYNVHMYFVNALYGYALLPLYHLFPTVSWYYIGEMLGTFISFVTISYVLLKKLGFGWGSALSLLLLTLLAPTFYLQVQFTQCAALFSATGMLTLLWDISQKNSKLFLLGLFLLFWGSLMRWQAFLMGLPFLAIATFLQYKFCLLNKKKFISIVIIAITTILGAHFFDRSLYNTPEYKNFKEIQGPRATFGDGANYNNAGVKNSFEKYGYSEEDFNMLKKWKFYDTDVFAPEKLLKLAQFTYQHTNQLSTIDYLNRLKETLSLSIMHPICWAFFAFSILLVFSKSNQKIYPLAAIITVALLLGQLIYLNRVVLRVENGIWAYATLLCIPNFGEIRPLSHKLYLIINLVILSTFAVWVTATMPEQKAFFNKVREKTHHNYIDAKRYMESFPENTLFLTDMPTYIMFYKRPPYQAEPIGSYKNIISYGYWTPYLPEITQSLKEHNVNNPIKDVVHENVIVIGDPNLTNYLQLHYFDKISVDTLEKFGHYKFYKYNVINAKQEH